MYVMMPTDVRAVVNVCDVLNWHRDDVSSIKWTINSVSACALTVVFACRGCRPVLPALGDCSACCTFNVGLTDITAASGSKSSYLNDTKYAGGPPAWGYMQSVAWQRLDQSVSVSWAAGSPRAVQSTLKWLEFQTTINAFKDLKLLVKLCALPNHPDIIARSRRQQIQPVLCVFLLVSCPYKGFVAGLQLGNVMCLPPTVQQVSQLSGPSINTRYWSITPVQDTQTLLILKP